MAILERQPVEVSTILNPKVEVVERIVTLKDIGRKTIETDAIVLSDLHMGAYFSKAETAGIILTSVKTPWIILNGDTYDTNKLEGKLGWADQRLILIASAFFRQKEKKVRGTLIGGNHDGQMSQQQQRALGLSLQEFEIIEFDGIKIAILHGHQGENCLPKEGSVVHMFASFAHHVAMVFRLKGLHDKLGNPIFGLNEKVAKSALDFAIEHNADAVICGHTHHPEHRIKDGIHYVNGGGFGTSLPSFLTIDADDLGVVINRYILKR